MWKKLRGKLPKSWNTTRIENRIGGGVPDVHVCVDGISFWIELKTTKTSRVVISSHQIAWNFAYHAAGGVSFFLISPLLSPNLYLFDGVHGRELLDHGLRTAPPGSGWGSGSVTAVPCLWSGSDWSGVGDAMIEVGRGRVGVVESGSGRRDGRVGVGAVGVGVEVDPPEKGGRLPRG